MLAEIAEIAAIVVAAFAAFAAKPPLLQRAVQHARMAVVDAGVVAFVVVLLEVAKPLH